jgi:hypothetical protein
VVLELGEFGNLIINIWKILGGGVRKGCKGYVGQIA